MGRGVGEISDGDYVYQGFIKRGYLPFQAAALAGNMQRESDFDPAAYNSGENAYGALQWRLDRKTGLENYAKQSGKSVADLDLQMDNVVREMLGPEAKAAKAFLAASDLPSANAALRGFIRYGDNSEGERLKYAQAFMSGDANAAEPDAQAKGAPGTPTGKSDFLKSWREGAGGAEATPSAAAPEGRPIPAKADFLREWRGGAATPAAPAEPIAPAAAAPGANVFSGQTPGAFGNNPMAPPEAPPAMAPNSAEPYADSYLAQGMSGVNEGIGNILGMPVDMATGGINGLIMGANMLTGAGIPTIQNPFLGSGQINQFLADTGAVKPQTDDPGKRFVRRVAQEVGATAVPVLGQVGRVAQPLRMAAAELGLATGSGAGAATANYLMPDNPYAEMAGQVLGGLSAAGAGKALAKGVTPFGIAPERKAAIEALEANGVNSLTAGQKTGSEALKQIEANVGGNRLMEKIGGQKDQFTAATLKSAGIDAKRATPEAIDQAFSRVGNEFDELAKRNTMFADADLVKDLKDVWGGYTSLVNPSARAPIVEKTVRDISEALSANKGQISGEAYQALRSRLDKAARAAKADPQLSDALFGLRGALDDAMERSISGDDVAAWKKARTEYRNLLAIERTVAGAGEDAALGIISPVRLKNAAIAQGGKRGYARGSNELGAMARNALIAMGDMPAATKSANFLGLSPSQIVGGIGGTLANGPVGTAAGIGLGKLADKVLPTIQGNMLMSAPVQRYLANSLMTDNPRLFQMGLAAVPGGAANATGNMAGKRQPLEIVVTGGNRQ